MKVVRVTTAALVLLLPLALAACGGSSSANSPTASAGTSTTGGGPANAARRAQIVACLQKQGITLPPRRPGGAGGGPRRGGGVFGPTGPTGTRGPGLGARNNPAVRAALAKCGIQIGQFGGGRARNSSAFRARLTAFATCMRSNGYNLPAPNTSGSGPVFGNVNRNDPKFKTAYAKCQSTLGGFFRGGGQGAGG